MLAQNGKIVFPDRGDIDLPNEYAGGAITVLAFKLEDYDVNRLFDWKSFAKKGDVSDKEYEKKPSEDVMEKNIMYIYMNINGECETAQKKAIRRVGHALQ